jgi:hypothetical protein
MTVAPVISVGCHSAPIPTTIKVNAAIAALVNAVIAAWSCGGAPDIQF